MDGGGAAELHPAGLCSPLPCHCSVLLPAGQSFRSLFFFLFIIFPSGAGAPREPQGDLGLHCGFSGLLGPLPQRPPGWCVRTAGGNASDLWPGERDLRGLTSHPVPVLASLLFQPHPLQLHQQKLPLWPHESLHFQILDEDGLGTSHWGFKRVWGWILCCGCREPTADLKVTKLFYKKLLIQCKRMLQLIGYAHYQHHVIIRQWVTEKLQDCDISSLVDSLKST